ncbi:ATP cone domain-containing protein, partial [Streptococcus suis]
PLIKSARTVYVIDDRWRQHLAQVTKKVVMDLEEVQAERLTINMIQSLVENRLIDAVYITIAVHYIAYSLRRDLERNG